MVLLAMGLAVVRVAKAMKAIDLNCMLIFIVYHRDTWNIQLDMFENWLVIEVLSY